MTDKNNNKNKVLESFLNARPIVFIRQSYGQFLHFQQLKLSNHFDGLGMVAFLGILCGLLSASVILLFRFVVEQNLGLFLPVIDEELGQFLPNANIELFEGLTPAMRFALCVGGGLLVGLLLQLLKPSTQQTGVVHVIERLDYHQGNLPIKNALVQFIGATISLVSGQSVGKEGPSVHLGAASGSILGRLLRVPNNSIRTLVACGVAAAIAAAFNTPLAAVIFAMEVVLMEYTIIGFTPVILAAVSATALTRSIYGDYSAFAVPAFDLHSIQELPIVAVLGIAIGCLSVLFTQSTLFISHLFQKRAIWVKTTIAGFIAGCISLIFPQVMGTGYDTVNAVMLSQLGLGFILLLILAKVLATSSAVGLGIPAGLIGPTLFIGACAGSAIGIVADSYLLIDIADAGFYTVLGMAAMMAATLQAPLAALIYLLELTSNVSIIMPGMIAVIAALLTVHVIFKQTSIYRLLLLDKGLDYRNSPISQALRRIGVASVMERNIVQQHNEISVEQAKELLKQEPRWILLPNTEQYKTSILPATDLAHYLNNIEINNAGDDVEPNNETDKAPLIDLFNIPAKRRDTAGISMISTLQEAHEKMQSEGCDILYITGAHGQGKNKIFGIITLEHIESSYRV